MIDNVLIDTNAVLLSYGYTSCSHPLASATPIVPYLALGSTIT